MIEGIDNGNNTKKYVSQFQELSFAQTKQWLLNWFSLTRQEKRKFDWQSRNVVLFKMLIPIFFNGVDLTQIVVPHYDLNDKFNRFFTSTFRIKSISWLSEDAYNLNQMFIMSLDKQIDVAEGLKRNSSIKNEAKNKKFSHLVDNYRAKTWSKIQHYSNIVKLSSICQGGQSKIVYADKNIIDRFRLDLLKEDYNIKNQFLNHFLFCNTFPAFSINNVCVQRLKKGQNVRGFQQRVFIIYEGSVIQQTALKNPTNQNNKRFGEKWRFQLVRGSLICKSNLKNFLQDSNLAHANENKYIHTYNLLTDSTFLTISHAELTKIIKIEKKILKKLIVEKIKNVEQTHQQFIRKSLDAHQVMKQAKNNPPQFFYSIPRNKKSKAFRKRTQFKQNNYQEFITLNRYEKMTQNKQNVEKRHLAYQQIKIQMREKQKQERFFKKIKTQKGQRQLKKCQYQARLKQSKIQTLAIKDSIVNTEKFRDRPNQVKFIFEEDIVEKYLSLGTEKRIQNSSHNKKTKFVSMVEFSEQKSQSRYEKGEFKMQLFEEFRKPKSRKNSRFYNKSVKFLQCESTPNIIDTSTPPLKKMI